MKKHRHKPGKSKKVEQLVALSPPFTCSQLLVQAANFHQAGQLQEAEQLYRQLLQNYPEKIELWGTLGNLLQEQERFDEAKECYHRLLQVRPRHEVALNNLGNVFQQQRQVEKAIAYYQQALAVNPNYAQAHNNLGVMWQKQNKLEEALVCYQRALAINPNYAQAHNNLGALYQEQGKLEEALTCLQRALALHPLFAEAYDTLAKVFAEQRSFEEAEICCRHVLTLKPEWAELHKNLGQVLATQGKFEDAKLSFHQALKLNPNSPGITVKLALMLPVIQSSQQELLASRQRVENNLTELLKSDIKLEDPLVEAGEINFYSTYYGLNEREISMKLANFYEQTCPSLLYTAPHCGETYRRVVSHQRIKVGFVLRISQMGRIMSGMIAHLSRAKFQVHVFSVPPESDNEILQTLQSQADNFESLPRHLEGARQLLAAKRLDILFYPSIGDDPVFIYFLAFARLAPVQCTTWGFPRTTGLRNLDYFLSAQDMETEEGEAHYSETLIRLKRLPIFFSKPVLSAPVKDRHSFGLSDQQHVYYCPQSLFKFLPDFDLVLADILCQDPVGQVALMEGSCVHWTELLRQRFRQTIPQVMERICFLPRLNFDVYLNLIAQSDVMLDTFPFGGGLTTHDALAVGTPVVTFPSQFMRGRATYYCYQKMGMMDCVAESPQHYVEIALRLGTDAAFRERIKAKILATHQVLYEDMEAVRELEEFLVAAVEKVS